MNIFDDKPKKFSSNNLPLGYNFDELLENLDIDLKQQIACSFLSCNHTLIFKVSTICCIVKTMRDIKENPKKYSKKDQLLIDDTNSAIMEMALDKDTTKLN